MADMIKNRAEAYELAASRAAAYQFLSDVYYKEMPREFLEQLRDDAVVLEGELDSFAQSLAEADIEAVRVELAAEYARMFLGMSRSPVAPYESVYTSDLHILMQEPRDAVLREYRAAGYGLLPGANIPEDHVAFEFDFMANTCQRIAEASEASDDTEAARLLEIQARFVEDHLLRWVPALVDDILARVSTPFYRGVANLTLQLVHTEHELLCEQAA